MHMQHFTPAPFTTNYSSRVFLMSLEVSQVKHTMCGIVTIHASACEHALVAKSRASNHLPNENGPLVPVLLPQPLVHRRLM
ncbi:hypothetical protein HZ326_7942 [Fusarium oxysporum f. sp. albedinis]|nr:hypothetical protein HZ326_7942 [Fusarium oxysporum f. sp. albedinis]